MSAHSIIPPSSAGIWGKPGGCTGWVGMMQALPAVEEETEAQAEGTASHEVGSTGLARALRGDLGTQLTVGDLAPNGVELNEEMVDGAEIYVDDVMSVVQPQRHLGLRYGNEERLTAHKLVHPLSDGTPDFWVYLPKSQHLIVWDYKFGRVTVEAFENYQGLNYVAMVIEKLGLSVDEVTVEVRIVQPRAHHREGVKRNWVLRAGQLKPYIETLASNAAIALGPDAMLQTGSHCRRCDARHGCPLALRAGLSFLEMAGAPVPVELNPHELGLQLRILRRAEEQLKGLKSGYEEQVKAHIKRGAVVPFWDLVPSQGREAWTKSIAEVVQLGDLLGVDLRKDGAVTPNQARKAGLDPATLALYSGRKTGLALTYDGGDKVRKLFS